MMIAFRKQITTGIVGVRGLRSIHRPFLFFHSQLDQEEAKFVAEGIYHSAFLHLKFLGFYVKRLTLALTTHKGKSSAPAMAGYFAVRFEDETQATLFRLRFGWEMFDERADEKLESERRNSKRRKTK